MMVQDANRDRGPTPSQREPLQGGPSAPTAPHTSPPSPRLAGVGRRLLITALGVAPVVAVLVVLGSRLGKGRARSSIGVNNETQQASVKPRPAPDFRLAAFDGTEFRLSAHRGKVVIINFWASWCGPCRLEARNLEAVHRQLAPEGLTMLGMNVWDDEPDARSFIEEFDITYVNVPDPSGKVAIDFAIIGIPETFMVDRKGVVVQHWIGPLTERQLISSVQPLLDEPPP